MLEQLRRDFPDHSRAPSALYQITKLQAAGGAVERLQAISPDSPHYLDAQYDLCVLAHEKWRASQSQAAKADAARSVVDAVTRFLNIQSAEAPAERRLKAALMGAAAAEDSQPGRAAALSLLAEVPAPPPTEPLAPEYYYRSMLAALAQKDAGAAMAHADWLRRHAAGSRFQLPAMVVAAQAAGADVQGLDADAPDAERRLTLIRARDAYQHLVDMLGDDREALRGSRNAQVALYRLAEYQMRLQTPRQAAANMRKLLEISPQSRPYVLGAARALYQAADYQAALPLWRSLLRGAAVDKQWFEAKYHQIACLQRQDPAKALAVWEQCHALYPHPEAPWREPLERLGRELRAARR